MEIEIVKLVQKLSCNFCDYLFYALTSFGEEIFFFAVFLILWWCVSKNSAVKLMFVYFVSVGINSLVKFLVNRPRPYMASSEVINKLPANGSSFPSGHSQSFACVSGFVYFNNLSKSDIKNKKFYLLGFILFGLFGVGLSRLYLGQHYLSDVLVGLLFGYIISYLMCKVLDKVKLKQFKNNKIIIASVIIVLTICCDLIIGLTEILNAHEKLVVFQFSGFIISIVVSYFLIDKIKSNNFESLKIKSIKSIIGLIFVAIFYLLLNLFLKNYIVLELIKFLFLGLFALLLLPFVFNVIISKVKIKGNENMLKAEINEYVCNNLKQTKKFAKKFAKSVKGGTIILLTGDLGAGKTTFTKFLLSALKVKDNIQSPTFTILREYETKKLKFYHFDMYRIEDSSEAYGFGFEEYVNNIKNDSVVLIEWWENVKEILPNNCLKIEILKMGETSRKFIITKDFKVN